MNNIMTLCDIFHCRLNNLVHEDITDFDSLDEENGVFNDCSDNINMPNGLKMIVKATTAGCIESHLVVL